MREDEQGNQPDLAEIQERSRETVKRLRENLARLKTNIEALRQTAERSAVVGECFQRKIIPLLQETRDQANDSDERRSA